MDESERNRLTKNQTALLLAASDMTQSIAAAKRLETEPDGDLARALETTIAVSYMRPFTGQPPGRLPDEYLPSGDPDAEYHAELKDLRDKVYAHTDRASGRSVSVELATRDGDIVQVTFKEQWLPLPPQDVLPIPLLTLLPSHGGRLATDLVATAARLSQCGEPNAMALPTTLPALTLRPVTVAG